MTYQLPFAALSDPTRPAVFERLRSGPQSVGAIARGLPVSRPAVSQHLKVLKEAGLVIDRPEGTRRVYCIDPDGLGALRAWLDQFWDEALAAFQSGSRRRSAEDKGGGSNEPGDRHCAGAQEHSRQRKPGACLRGIHRRSRALVARARPTIGKPPRKTTVLETRLGGRWYDVSEDGSEANVGKVLVWEPPHRFVVSWDINSKWKPDTTVGSEVEIRFVADGPEATIVELEHRKFEQMGAEAGESMRRDVDGGWPDILQHFKTAAEA